MLKEPQGNFPLAFAFKQMKQNSWPHGHFICLQLRMCSMSKPHFTQARRDGQLATPTISFFGHSLRIFKRGSWPVHAALPTELENFSSNQIIFLFWGEWCCVKAANVHLMDYSPFRQTFEITFRNLITLFRAKYNSIQNSQTSFTLLYFPHITMFCNQTLQFY